jgi:hypothetical protein
VKKKNDSRRFQKTNTIEEGAQGGARVIARAVILQNKRIDLR